MQNSSLFVAACEWMMPRWWIWREHDDLSIKVKAEMTSFRQPIFFGLVWFDGGDGNLVELPNANRVRETALVPIQCEIVLFHKYEDIVPASSAFSGYSYIYRGKQ